MAGITLLNVNLIGVVSRTMTTRLGDGGIVEQVQSYSCRTASRWHTIAQARVVAQQLREMVWYSRHAGGIYVTSDDHTIESGLYRLVDVTATPRLDSSTTAIIEVDLALIRVGGVSANVTRWLHVQPTLQANSWSVPSTPWHALPSGAQVIENPGSGTLISRTGADGGVGVRQSSTSIRYVLSGADHNAGECKLWDTGGSGTEANWTRVYSPDHEFAQPHQCALDNSLIRFVPVSGSPGEYTFRVYDGAAWRQVGTQTYARVVSGTVLTAWRRLLVTEVTPWRVSLSVWCSTAASSAYVRLDLTLERGRPLALVVLTVPSAVELRLGLIGLTNARFTLGHDTTNNVGDGYDSDVDSGFPMLSDADDNWLALVGDTADHDVLAVIAARTATNSALTAAQGGGGWVSQTGATTLAVYIGGIAYNTAGISAEAEGGSLGGTAAITTVAGSSGGASNNAVTLPTTTAAVTLLPAGSPTLDGTANITIRMYARVQNVGTSASDSVSLRVYNDTAANYPAQTIHTFATLGSTGAWKWISVEWTGWNGSDALYPEVRRWADGGGGSLYCDQAVILTLDSGVDGPRNVARAALTECRVWPEHSRVSV